MSIKRIVFHAEDGLGFEDRLAVALLLAHQRGAALHGVYSLLAPDMPAYAATMIPEEVLKASWDRGVKEAKALEQAFLHAAENAQVEATWALSNQPPAQALAGAAHIADLVIVAQPQHMGSPRDTLVDSVALHAGRPVLMLPRQGAHLGFGARVLLAWNATREAARAMGDGLPWLEKAARVDVLSIGEPDRTGHGASAADACTYLAAHGVSASAHQVGTATDGAGKVLQRWVVDHDNDLVIMGAYGHSRLRELVMGGATAAMISECPVPVLLAH